MEAPTLPDDTAAVAAGQASVPSVAPSVHTESRQEEAGEGNVDVAALLEGIDWEAEFSGELMPQGSPPLAPTADAATAGPQEAAQDTPGACPICTRPFDSADAAVRCDRG